MEIEEIIAKLTNDIEKEKIIKNAKMSQYTTFKIGGNADIMVKASSIKDFTHTINIAKKYNMPIFILGNGSNILVKDLGIRGIVIKNEMNDLKIDKKEETAIITVSSGIKIAGLAQILAKEEIEGFEFASGIPGSIGGAIKMNAGAHGKEMKDIVISTKYMDYEGNIYTIENKEHEFRYRNSIFSKNKFIILQTTLELKRGKKENIQEKIKEYSDYRKNNQPINYPSAGSTFKRGKDFISSKLIDEAGLKGYMIGGAKISDLHAGFIVNVGNATAKNVLDLIEYTKKTVYDKFNKNIELELEVIGE